MVTSVLVLRKYLAAAVLFTMFFTARKLIIKTERSTHTDLNNIFGSLPKRIWILREQLEIEVPLNTLQTNDIMVVRALEKLAKVDTIIFDKTGTLTEKIPQVERIVVCNGFTEQKLLQYAATAEQRQKHPIAQAVCQAAAQQNLLYFPIKNSDYEVGYGIRVSFVDPETDSKVQTILLGSERYMGRLLLIQQKLS